MTRRCLEIEPGVFRECAKKPPARGHKHRGKSTMLKTVILLDDETFSDVRDGALRNSCSFAAQARMLIEVGLETLKEPAR